MVLRMLKPDSLAILHCSEGSQETHTDVVSAVRTLYRHRSVELTSGADVTRNRRGLKARSRGR
jgi:hypothetical protein